VPSVVNTGTSLSTTPDNLPAARPRRDARTLCSHAALGLALALLMATFFLISPPPGETYPGAIPWGDLSILRPLIDLMSLNGLLATVRGVEIKDFAFHLAAALGLALLGLCTVTSPVASPPRGRRRTPSGTPAPASTGATLAGKVAGYAQILLAGWVLLSLASSLWSGHPGFARGQALLYALAVAWAATLAHTLTRRDIFRLLTGLVVISGLGALLCVWYYYERNPHHRPGFPLGNPTVLAAVLLPAVLICLCTATAGLWRALRTRQTAGLGLAIGATLALVPLAWCLALAKSRGALIALGVGIAAIVVLAVSRWLRWILATVFAIMLTLAGVGLYYTSHLDVTMARGAAMRFRVYAWRYAAMLWGDRPVAGNGAGSYPLLAGQLAVGDRVLDPAAFMGDLIEHAHNELFEVLTEIGLVGGVTFVAGLLATFVAAAWLIRRQILPGQRWQALGVIGGLVALWADSMVGVTLRLPGGPAMAWTLMGLVWALASQSPFPLREGPEEGQTSEGEGLNNSGTPALRFAYPRTAATLCFLAAAGTGWIAVQNWIGVLHEESAASAAKAGAYPLALEQSLLAESRLLDPVRHEIALANELNYRWMIASQAVAAASAKATSAPTAASLDRAVALARDTYLSAVELRRTVPALETTDAVAASAAAWLANLFHDTDPAQAHQWMRESWRAWIDQQRRTPYDVTTLLALTEFPGTVSDYLGLLRDALRFLRTLPLDERPQDAHPTRRLWFVWHDRLRRLAQAPGFEATLADRLAAAGPISPSTDLDALIASLAPETYRLLAAWHAQRGEFAPAAAANAHAAELYYPLRARFPELYSVALAEQADYLLRAAAAHGSPADGTASAPAGPASEPERQRAGIPSAIDLLQQAIAALPQIQEQKYEELVRPFRDQLALCQLADGQYDAGLETLRETLEAPDVRCDVVEQGVNDLLRDAAIVGEPLPMLKQIAAALCPRYESLCHASGTATRSTQTAPSPEAQP
jgi:O-antigen ligase